MNQKWDDNKGGDENWIEWLAEIMAECLRIIKPGGHLLCWALPRTSYLTGMAISKGGWNLKDCLIHHFGSGFPKGLNISKAIDKQAGVERKVVSKRKLTGKARVLKGNN